MANTADDSVLAEFGSAVDAVQCAVEAQDALAEANSGLAPDRCISRRFTGRKGLGRSPKLALLHRQPMIAVAGGIQHGLD